MQHQTGQALCGEPCSAGQGQQKQQQKQQLLQQRPRQQQQQQHSTRRNSHQAEQSDNKKLKISDGLNQLGEGLQKAVALSAAASPSLLACEERTKQ